MKECALTVINEAIYKAHPESDGSEYKTLADVRYGDRDKGQGDMVIIAMDGLAFDCDFLEQPEWKTLYGEETIRPHSVFDKVVQTGRFVNFFLKRKFLVDEVIKENSA